MNVQTIKSIVPSIAALVFRAKVTDGMAPQTCAIAALAILRMLTSFSRSDAVPMIALVELAANSLKEANSRNNDLKAFHYTAEPITLIGLAKHFGFLSVDDNKCIVHSELWTELVTVKAHSTPFTTKVTSETRRKPHVKGGKAKPSKLLEGCIDFLQETAYHVDSAMVHIVDAVCDQYAMRGADFPLAIQQEQHVWNSSKQLVSFEELFSDYFADNRGRLYHIACAGPNPQSSDFARSLYSHNIENWVNKFEADGVTHTAAYKMFMLELEDIASDSWVETRMLSRVAANPVGALKTILEMNKDAKPPKKPFTYIRLALDWNEFETKGCCDSRIGFGLDAKCSGTQYLAFIAGNMEMAQATGLVNTESKAADPYQLSLVQLKMLVNFPESIMEQYLNPKAGRAFIKTPYMAVQYGGAENALLGNKDFYQYSVEKLQLSHEEIEVFASMCVAAVHNALGDKINLFIEKVQQAVEAKCVALGKPYFTYKHTDGQVVNKPCFPTIDVCEAFSIRIDSQTRVIFGQQAENKPWQIRAAQPTMDEFVRTFVVNYIQGIDALVARTVAKYAKEAGLRGFTSIHDCFRCCLADAPLMMNVIRKAYVEIFVHNNQFEALSKQLDGINMYHTNIVTEELLMSEHAYYFCQ